MPDKLIPPVEYYDENGKLLLRKGYIIESEKQLLTIISRGLYQDINEIPDEAESQDTGEAGAVISLLETAHDNLAYAFDDIQDTLKVRGIR